MNLQPDQYFLSNEFSGEPPSNYEQARTEFRADIFRAMSEQVRTLSQAKVLRDLPPKKHPKPLPAEAGIAPKRAEKVAGQLARQR
jgi:hypothetical protein